MHYFVTASNGSTNHLCMHPLFLSLIMAFSKSEKSSDIGSLSENDPRTLNNDCYTPPSDLSPLNIQFPGQDGMADLSDILTWQGLSIQHWMFTPRGRSTGAHLARSLTVSHIFWCYHKQRYSCCKIIFYEVSSKPVSCWWKHWSNCWCQAYGGWRRWNFNYMSWSVKTAKD